MGIQCHNSDIRPFLSNDGQRMIELASEKSFGEEAIAILEKMHKECMISGLDITRRGVEDKDIKKLTSFLHNPYQLLIKNAKIKEIPSGWLQSLKVLDCRNCKALTSLDAPNAKELDCSGCNALTSLGVSENCELSGVPDGCKVTFV